MKYWVLELESCGHSQGTKEARGPFPSLALAEKWIAEDCLDVFSYSDSIKIGENPDWSGQMLILQEVKRVTPTPTVSCKIELKETK